MSAARLRVSAPPSAVPFVRRRGLHEAVAIVGAVRAVRLNVVKSWLWQEWAENEAQAWALDAPERMPAGCMRSARAGGYWGPAVCVRGQS